MFLCIERMRLAYECKKKRVERKYIPRREKNREKKEKKSERTKWTKSPNDLFGRARWNGPWTLYWRRWADSGGTLDNQKLHDLSAAPFQLQRRPVRTHAHKHTHTHTHSTHKHIYITIKSIYMMCVLCSLGLSPSLHTRHTTKESPRRAVRSNGSFCMSSSRPLLFIFTTSPTPRQSQLVLTTLHTYRRLCHTRATRLGLRQFIPPLTHQTAPLPPDGQSIARAARLLDYDTNPLL